MNTPKPSKITRLVTLVLVCAAVFGAALADGVWSLAPAPSLDASDSAAPPSFDGVAIPHLHYVVGSAVSDTLPTAVGDESGALAYALNSTPALPSGLAFDGASRTISGTPDGSASAAATYTLTAADSASNSASLQFQISVAASSAPKPTAVVIESSPSNGVTYAAGDTLVAVVKFSPDVSVSGMPQLALEVGLNTRLANYAPLRSDENDLAFVYTIQSGDFDGDGVSVGRGALSLNGGGISDWDDSSLAASLRVGHLSVSSSSPYTVNDTSPVLTAPIESRVWITHATTTPQILPMAMGGDGAVSHALSPTTMPAGMRWVASERKIAGVPTEAAAAATYTWTATDADGDTDSRSFTLEVVEETAPAVTGVTFTSTPASGVNYKTGETITVAVDIDRGAELSGDPYLTLAVGASARRMAYTAKNAACDRHIFSYTVAADDLDGDGVSVTALSLGEGGGLRPLTRVYPLTDAPSLGTHAVSNDSAHRVNDTAPSFGAARVDGKLWDLNSATTPIILPQATGGDGTVNYALAPTALPQGMTWTASTRTIAGSPTEKIAPRAYTWTATDADGDSAALAFYLAVWDPPGPAVTGVSIISTDSDSNYETGDTILLAVEYAAPLFVTGEPSLALIVGDKTVKAVYDAETSQSVGARSIVFAYTVREGDRDGDGVAVPVDGLDLMNAASMRDEKDDDAKLSLGSHAIASGVGLSAGMRVNDAAPSFGSASVSDMLYDANAAISPIVLPTATGGDGSLSYALSPTALPRGMTWTASTRTIAGTPTSTMQAQTYTWTATDADGDETSLTFSITVWDPKGPAVSSIGAYREDDDGNFKTGDAIGVAVVYEAPVSVQGEPRLALVIGDKKVYASYDSASSDAFNAIIRSSGGKEGALVFSYLVQASDWDGDGLAIPTDALSLNGATIASADDNSYAKLNLGSQAIASGDARSANMRVNDTAPRRRAGENVPGVVKIALNVPVSHTLLASGASGDAPFTYGIAPSLPQGLALNTSGGGLTITGRLSSAYSGTHTLSATDRDGDTAPLGRFALSANVAAVVDEATFLSRPYANGAYGAGEIIEIAVGFDRAVATSGLGASSLTLDVGGVSRSAGYARTDAGGRLVYAYAVQASDSDSNGIGFATDALTLNGATITDSLSTVPATLALGVNAIANAASHKVNGSVSTPMAVESVAFASAPADSAGYDAGETIIVKVTFSKPATVTGSPRLALQVGSAIRQAGYRAADSARDVLAFGYTATHQDKDADGVSILADALTLNGGTIQDSGGASAALGLGTRAITNDPAHKVHTPPRVTGVEIISNPGVNGTYDAGESILLRVSFSETTSETGSSQVALDIGANTRRAARWFDPNAALRGNLYQYTVTADDFDGDGISVRSDALTLTQGARLFALWDSETAVLSLGSHAIANDSAHTVRDNAPGFPRFGRQNVVAGTAASITLPAATGGDGAITYALAPTTMPDGLTFNPSTRRITGTPTAQAVAPAATYTWTATDADGDSTPLTFTIAVAAADAPKVTAVGFRSAPRAQNTYDVQSMNPIAVFVRFDKIVSVTGTPLLDLEIGDETVQARYYGRSMNNWMTQIFSYSVKVGDRDSDGISIRAGALSLNGGTMRCLVPSEGCATAMDAALGLGSHAITNDANHKVNGGVNIPPAVTDVEIVRTVMTAPPSNVYEAGDRIIINVEFSENLTLIGSPSIGLRVGDDSRRAAFKGVVRDAPTDPYKILQFEYTFMPTDSDSDGISVLDTLDGNGNVTTHALNLNGGTLRDSGGANAVLDLASPRRNQRRPLQGIVPAQDNGG